METTNLKIDNEVRFIEIRANVEDITNREIKGTAIVFNVESNLLGGMFREVILPCAVSQELLDSSDIVMTYQHEDDTVPLARKNTRGANTLNIVLTETGVDFSFTAKNTAFSTEVLEGVRAGDITDCSFAFCIAEGGDTWTARPDGTYLRTINKFESLHDFSIVINPAYVDAQLNTRGLDELKAKAEAEAGVAKAEAEKREVEHKEYIQGLKAIVDKLKN
jgi:HK97 family phage prohead protease